MSSAFRYARLCAVSTLLLSLGAYFYAYYHAEVLAGQSARLASQINVFLAGTELRNHARSIAAMLRAHRARWQSGATVLSAHPRVLALFDDGLSPEVRKASLDGFLSILDAGLPGLSGVVSLRLLALDERELARTGRFESVTLASGGSASGQSQGDIVIRPDNALRIVTDVVGPDDGRVLGFLEAGFVFGSLVDLVKQAGGGEGGGAGGRAFLWGAGSRWILAQGPSADPGQAVSARTARRDVALLEADRPHDIDGLFRSGDDIAAFVRVSSSDGTDSARWTIMLYRSGDDARVIGDLVDRLSRGIAAFPLWAALACALCTLAAFAFGWFSARH